MSRVFSCDPNVFLKRGVNVLGLSSGSGVIYGHGENATVVQRSAPPAGHTIQQQ